MFGSIPRRAAAGKSSREQAKCDVCVLAPCVQRVGVSGALGVWPGQVLRELESLFTRKGQMAKNGWQKDQADQWLPGRRARSS
jgi:hypothetical protein